MSDIKVNIYAPSGERVGYFLNPKVAAFPEGDYELQGTFYDETGQIPAKVMMNPQAIPYSADMSEVKDNAHKKLRNVYVQRCRQPISMIGAGS